MVSVIKARTVGSCLEEYSGRDLVSLPRFFSRISYLISPLLVAGSDVGQFLSTKSVRLDAPAALEAHPHLLAGFHLLVNLCARLYPGIRIVAPSRTADECRAFALAINPVCDVSLGEGGGDPAGAL